MASRAAARPLGHHQAHRASGCPLLLGQALAVGLGAKRTLVLLSSRVLLYCIGGRDPCSSCASLASGHGTELLAFTSFAAMLPASSSPSSRSCSRSSQGVRMSDAVRPNLGSPSPSYRLILR